MARVQHRPKDDGGNRESFWRRRVNQTVIADKLGLSTMAVSKALRDNGDIAPATRRKVQALARRLGYRHNRIAQSLVAGRTRLLGALLPSFHDNFLARLLHAMEMAARENNYKILPAVWDEHQDTDDPDVQMLLQYQPDGLIVFPRLAADWSGGLYARLLRQSARLVFLNYPMKLPGAVSVYSDDAHGAREAVRYLIGHGHRRILLARPEFAAASYELRERGYRAALRDARLPLDAGLIVATPHPLCSVRLADLLAARPEVTAAFCATDSLAINLMAELWRRGMSLPDRLSIVGYGDDIPHPEITRLPLTTVSQTPDEMGRQAVRALIALIEGAATEREIRTPTRLIERASVRKNDHERHGTRAADRSRLI